MRKTQLIRLAGGLLLALSPLASHALTAITDNAGDYLATFAGQTSSTDLDVINATVLYDGSADMFKLTGTMNGAIGTSDDGFYVWGVNRGAGTASFAANGIDGVRFDRVILVRPDRTGTVAGVGNLPPGSISILGNTITALVSGAVLPSTGFAKMDYTWNLWPRDGGYTGFSAISDFAPDNANFATLPGAVPLPPTALLFGSVLLTLGALRRRAR